MHRNEDLHYNDTRRVCLLMGRGQPLADFYYNEQEPKSNVVVNRRILSKNVVVRQAQPEHTVDALHWGAANLRPIFTTAMILVYTNSCSIHTHINHN